MEKTLTSVYKNRKLSLFLNASSHIISALFVAAFLVIAGVIIYSGYYLDAILTVTSAFVGFLAVTVMRAVINAPRPYELYGFYEIKPKQKSGRSFPSRHAYSAFCITTLMFVVSTVFAYLMLVLAVIMCVCRVLTGIHFIRDVVAGALIGVISGLIGILLI